MNEELINALKAARLHIEGEALPTKVQALDIIMHALEAAAGALDLSSAIPTLPCILPAMNQHAIDDTEASAFQEGHRAALQQAAALASAAPVETAPGGAMNDVLLRYWEDARAIEARIMGGAK